MRLSTASRRTFMVLTATAFASAVAFGGVATAETAETASVPGTGCDLMQARFALHVENPDVSTRLTADAASKARLDDYFTAAKADRDSTQRQWGADAAAVKRAADTCAQY